MTRWNDDDPNEIKPGSRVLIPNRSAYREAKVLMVLGSWALVQYPGKLPMMARLADMQLRGES